MIKRPSFQFYPGDWLQDSALRCVSIAARGLWIDMICIMHQGTPYGHLTINGKGLLKNPLSRMEGVSVSELEGLLKELEDAGVFSTNSDGVIFSRRMVRDEALREIRAKGGIQGAEHGKKGGRPHLLKPLQGVGEGVMEGVGEGVKNKPLDPQQNNPPSSSSSSSSKRNTPALPVEYSEDFISFWAEYPRKLEKAAAWKAWNARIKEGHSPEIMIEGAKRYAKNTEQQETEERFIKHPASFLGPTTPFVEWSEKEVQEDEDEDDYYRITECSFLTAEERAAERAKKEKAAQAK